MLNNDDNDIEIEEEYQYEDEQESKPKQEMNDNEKANMLSFTALILFFAPEVITGIATTFFENGFLFKLLMLIARICPISAIITLTYVLVKYPQNTFGKTLGRILLIFMIYGLVVGIFFFVACGNALNDCNCIG